MPWGIVLLAAIRQHLIIPSRKQPAAGAKFCSFSGEKLLTGPPASLNRPQPLGGGVWDEKVIDYKQCIIVFRISLHFSNSEHAQTNTQTERANRYGVIIFSFWRKIKFPVPSSPFQWDSSLLNCSPSVGALPHR